METAADTRRFVLAKAGRRLSNALQPAGRKTQINHLAIVLKMSRSKKLYLGGVIVQKYDCMKLKIVSKIGYFIIAVDLSLTAKATADFPNRKDVR